MSSLQHAVNVHESDGTDGGEESGAGLRTTLDWVSVAWFRFGGELPPEPRACISKILPEAPNRGMSAIVSRMRSEGDNLLISSIVIVQPPYGNK